MKNKKQLCFISGLDKNRTCKSSHYECAALTNYATRPFKKVVRKEIC